MKAFRKEEGFTLVELMIVVVIIGILAAIAIPQFQKFQLRSKHGESGQIIGAIHGTQEGFASKWGAYGEFGEEPRGAAPTGEKASWTDCPDVAFGHCNIGFRPQGRTYFQYAVWDAGMAGAAGIPADFTTPAFNPSGGEATLGEDVDGYPCAHGANCTATAPIGMVRAHTGAHDIIIGSQGDLDNDGVICIYVATDENKDAKPDTANGICGEDVF